MRRPGVAITLIVVAGLAVGCGYKTSPRPATAAIPSEVGLVNAHAYPDRIVLSWSVPPSNTDGSPLKDISGFRVYRNEEKIGEECEDCEKETGVPTNIDFQNPSNASIEAGEVVYTDKAVHAGTTYSYSVGVYNLKGREGPLSEEVTVVFDDPPPPPDGLQAVANADGARLDWQSPGRLAGLRSYNVYRGTNADTHQMKSIGRTKWAETYFVDSDVKPDNVYYYAVRSVKMNRGIPLESGPSTVAEASMEPSRVQPPENVSAHSTESGIRVDWDPVTIDSEEVEYNVYRSKSRRMFMKLNNQPLDKPFYTDEDVRRGQTYRYAVTAFPKGKSNQESNRSASGAVRFSP